jgi:regulator of replication initiation timing
MDELEKVDIQQNHILQVRLQTLETENKRLRVELDWMREKLLEAETKLWFDQPITAS